MLSIPLTTTTTKKSPPSLQQQKKKSAVASKKCAAHSFRRYIHHEFHYAMHWRKTPAPIAYTRAHEGFRAENFLHLYDSITHSMCYAASQHRTMARFVVFLSFVWAIRLSGHVIRRFPNIFWHTRISTHTHTGTHKARRVVDCVCARARVCLCARAKAIFLMFSFCCQSGDRGWPENPITFSTWSINNTHELRWMESILVLDNWKVLDEIQINWNIHCIENNQSASRFEI